MMNDILETNIRIKDFRWIYNSFLTEEAKEYIVKNILAQIEKIAQEPLLDNLEIKEHLKNACSLEIKQIISEVIEEPKIKKLFKKAVKNKLMKMINDEFDKQ